MASTTLGSQAYGETALAGLKIGITAPGRPWGSRKVLCLVRQTNTVDFPMTFRRGLASTTIELGGRECDLHSRCGSHLREIFARLIAKATVGVPRRVFCGRRKN